MTYLELCQAVAREAGISGTGPSAVTGQTGENYRVVRWVRTADLEIQALFRDWKFHWGEYTFTTTASQRVYGSGTSGWPANLGRWVKDSAVLGRGTDDFQPLQWVEFQDWQTRYARPAAVEAKPTMFTVKPDDKSIILVDTPNSAYSIYLEYHKGPVEMTANTDESAIPSAYHDIIVYRALMMYARFESAQEIYQDAASSYLEWLTRLKNAYLPSEGDANGMAQADEPLVVMGDAWDHPEI